MLCSRTGLYFQFGYIRSDNSSSKTNQRGKFFDTVRAIFVPEKGTPRKWANLPRVTVGDDRLLLDAVRVILR